MQNSASVFPFDPICGMHLADDQVMAAHNYIGWTYFFCSTECYDQFVRMPEKHVVLLAHGEQEYVSHRYSPLHCKNDHP